MRQCFVMIVLALCSVPALAQNALISEGNKYFREGDLDKAISLYEEVLKTNPKDLTALYNRSNALAKKGDKEAAMEGYEKIIREAKDPSILEKAYYDKGVLHQQQQQLDESILSWMESLKLDPNDQQARENLQKALKEKQQQQQQQEKEKKEQDKKENKEDKEQQKPKPQNSKLNQKQVEQLLKALEQKEKEVQKKMQQRTGSSSRPEKDW